MKNGNESLIRKWKLRSIQKLERNSRNITKIEESRKMKKKKQWFVRLRDELTVKKWVKIVDNYHLVKNNMLIGYLVEISLLIIAEKSSLIYSKTDRAISIQPQKLK